MQYSLLLMDVDKIVPEAQIKQFPLPDGMFVSLGRAIDIDTVGFRNPFWDVTLGYRFFINDKPLRCQDSLWDGFNSEIAR